MDRDTGDSGKRAQNEEKPYKNTTQKTEIMSNKALPKNIGDELRCSRKVSSF